jgi:hypothetical protein
MTSLIAGGLHRIKRSPEFREKLKALRETIRAKHAEELAGAGFFRRILIRDRIAREFKRESCKLLPSPHALYGSKP